MRLAGRAHQLSDAIATRNGKPVSAQSDELERDREGLLAVAPSQELCNSHLAILPPCTDIEAHMPKNVIGQADHAAPETAGDKIMARIRKAVTAIVGLAVTLVAAGVLDDKTEAVVTGLIAIATAYGVYRIPNAKTPRV